MHYLLGFFGSAAKPKPLMMVKGELPFESFMILTDSDFDEDKLSQSQMQSVADEMEYGIGLVPFWVVRSSMLKIKALRAETLRDD